MKKSEFFFRKYEEYGLIPNEKYLDFFFNLVINKEYEQALILIQSIKQLFKEKETLKYHIKVKTNDMRVFRKFKEKGFRFRRKIKIKGNNTINREN